MTKRPRLMLALIPLFLIVFVSWRVWSDLRDGSATVRDVVGGIAAFGVVVLVCFAAVGIYVWQVSREIRTIRRRYPQNEFVQVRPAASILPIVLRQRRTVHEVPAWLILAADSSGIQLLLPGSLVRWASWSWEEVRVVARVEVVDGVALRDGIGIFLIDDQVVELLSAGGGALGLYPRSRLELDSTLARIAALRP